MKNFLEQLRAFSKDLTPDQMALFNQALFELGFVPKTQSNQIDRTAIIREVISAFANGIGIKSEMMGDDISKIDFAAIKAEMKTDMKKETETEIMARVTSILNTCSLAGMNQMAIVLISSDISIEEARTKVSDAKATISKRYRVRSVENPLLEGARKQFDTIVAQNKKQ